MDKIDLQTLADESKADCIKPWSSGLVLYSAISLRWIRADPQIHTVEFIKFVEATLSELSELSV